MQVDLTEKEWLRGIENLRSSISEDLEAASEVYLDLAGLKTVRLLVCDKSALKLIDRELSWIRTGPVPAPDATIVLWKIKALESFVKDVFGSDDTITPDIEYLPIVIRQIVDVHRSGSDAALVVRILPKGQVNFSDRTIHLAEGNTYYYGSENYEPEHWIKEGHLLVQMLFRILNDDPDACLVHGACLGLDGKGILMCARGQMGKSTLAVSALLRGFEFVSEDYLVLRRRESSLCASPLYSIISLSPRMYNALYDDLDKARFVGISHFKGKYVFDMSAYDDHLRYDYPIRACLFPEIDPEATEPRVEPCDHAQKSRAITNMAHSTVFQMWSFGLKQNQKDSDTILKIIRMLDGMDFYKITLTPDIFKNVECLREFVNGLK